LPQVARSQKDLEAAAVDQVETAIILHPNWPAAKIAEWVWENPPADDSLIPLAKTMLIRYLIAAAKSQRRKANPRPEQPPLFPGIDNLPRRIVTAEGKRPLLAKSTATQIREYVKSLNAKHRDRIEGLQTLLAIMGKYTPKNRKLTAQAVASLELENS
jgi:hypothetical protein